jgi:hypothetical protein
LDAAAILAQRHEAELKDKDHVGRLAPPARRW